MALSPLYQICFGTAAAAAGRDLTDAELDKFFTRAQARMENYKAQGLSDYDAANRAGEELAAESKLAAAVEARSKKINMMRQGELRAREIDGREIDSVRAVVTGFEGGHTDTLRTALTGKGHVGGDVRGAADSVDARGNANVEATLGGMTKELSAAGLLKPLLNQDKQFSRDLANELGRINDPTFGRATGNKFAAKAAAIISKYMEDLRVQQNAAGAWIGKLDQYITRQSHDADLIRGNGTPAAFAKWRDTITPLLDDKTWLDVGNAPADREEWLGNVWKALSTGVHEGADGGDWLSGFTGDANLAKKLSQNRKLFFKSADAWHDYNEAFGHGNTTGSVFKQIEHGARNAAIMRVLGTNPEAMLKGWVDRLVDKAKERGDVNQARQLSQEAGRYSGTLEYAMRKGAGSEVPRFTAMMGAMRSIQDFKLGGPLSYLSDLQTIASAARHNGVGLFESYAESVRGILPQGAELKDAAYDVGTGSEGFAGSLIARMRAADGARGKLASMASSYEKWNGVKYWVQHQKEAMGRMLSANLGRRVGGEFGDLPARLQATLRRYGIEEKEWDAIRATNMPMIDGRSYVMPGEVHNLDDAALHGVAGSTDASLVQNARQTLADKLQSYYTDQVRIGMSEPTAGIMRTMRGGDMRAATVSSELYRALLQFKTFPATHVMRSLTREIMRNPAGADVGGVAKLIAGTSLLGYLAYTMKKLARGQVPAVPDTRENAIKSVMEGMAQGGGLGIYGDFLFGDVSRFGGGVLSTALGPSFSMADSGITDIINDLHQVTEGGDAIPKKGLGREVASQGVQFFKQNGPMMNLWYARAAMDYAVLYSLQETVNPGYLRRYEKQMVKDQGVKFMLSPSRDHLQTFGR